MFLFTAVEFVIEFFIIGWTESICNKLQRIASSECVKVGGGSFHFFAISRILPSSGEYCERKPFNNCCLVLAGCTKGDVLLMNNNRETIFSWFSVWSVWNRNSYLFLILGYILRVFLTFGYFLATFSVTEERFL